MTQSFSDSPTTPATAVPERAKKSVGIIVLLSFVTLANAFSLLIGVVGWADEVDHGAEMTDPTLRVMIFTTIVSLVALVALGGAWFTRLWGPRLYVTTAGVSLLLGLIISQGAFSPLSLVGIALAVGLWLHAESNW